MGTERCSEGLGLTTIATSGNEDKMMGGLNNTPSIIQKFKYLFEEANKIALFKAGSLSEK